MKRWDVIVVGGGPAGAAAGLTLARSGRRVLVVEASDYSPFRAGETLPPAANPLLDEMGIGELFRAEDPRPAFAIWSAWGGAELVEAPFLKQPFGTGWHVDRRRFDAMLAGAAEQAGAVVKRRTRVRAVVPRGAGPGAKSPEGAPQDTEGVDVSVVDEGGNAEIHRAAWIVDASGRRARIARALGARGTRFDRLMGILAEMRSGAPVSDEAEVLVLEAAENGYFYSVPLPPPRDARGSALLVAFLTDADLFAREGSSPRAFLGRALAGCAHTRARAAPYSDIVSVHVRQASSWALNSVVGPSWIAAGDAALTFDPIAAQGILKALRQGARAGLAVDAALAGDRTLCEAHALEHDQAVRAYLEARGAHYAMETRWPRAQFWARRAVRRKPLIWLDPRALVRRSDAPSADAAARAEALLPPRHVAWLLRQAASEAPAHALLQRLREQFARRGSPVPDDRLIAGLQVLIAEGAISARKE